MKKTLAWIAAFCILTMLAPAGLAEVRFEKVFEYMPAIKPVVESNYVIVQSYEDGNFGVFTTAGEEVIPYRYASLTSLGNNFLYASLKSDDLNRHALVYIDGRQLSEYSYGSFKVYDSHWALGYILSQATKESYDLKIKKKYYRVEQTDVFYVSGEENEKCLVGSLPGYALASSQVHRDERKFPSKETVSPSSWAVWSMSMMSLRQLGASAGVMPDRCSQSKPPSSSFRSRPLKSYSVRAECFRS